MSVAPNLCCDETKNRGTYTRVTQGSSKKQESSRETSTFALLNTPNPLMVWITTVENY